MDNPSRIIPGHPKNGEDANRTIVRRILLGVAPDLADSLTGCLEALGFEVAGLAATPEKFKEMSRWLRPDVAILSSDFTSSEELLLLARFSLGQSSMLYIRAGTSSIDLSRLATGSWKGLILEPCEMTELSRLIELAAIAGRELLNPISGFFHFCVSESLSDYLFVLDRANRSIFMNRAATQRFQKGLAAGSGASIQEIFRIEAKAEAERIEALIETARTRFRTEVIEFQTGLLTNGNESLGLAGVVSPLRLPSSDCEGTVLSLHEHKGSRHDRSRLLKLTHVVRFMSDAVIITSVDGSIEYVNPAFETLTGYTWQEAVGKTPRILKSGDHTPEFYAELYRNITAGKGFRSVFKNRRKDGRFVFVDNDIFPIIGGGGRIEHYVSISREITEQIEKLSDLESKVATADSRNLRLRDALHIRSEFVATVSHEIRTPLSVILGGVENLLDGIFGPMTPEQSEMLEMMAMQSRQLTHIVGNVLDFEKLTEGLVDLDLKRVDLVGLIRNAGFALMRLAHQRNRILTINLPPHPLFILADAMRIDQVITNLVSNAIKYAEANLEINVQENDHDAWILVRDDGPGIPKEQIDVIFEKFVQARRHDKKEGAGLGLAIVLSIVQAHGGMVTADNRENGKHGAVFHVRLPLLDKGHA